MIAHIGIVGGGQLGRMLTQAALPLGFTVTVLDASPGCPAAQVGAQQVVGRVDDADALATLAGRVDVVTWEVEHIDAATLVVLEGQGAVVRPSPRMLAAVQDKYLQKQLLQAAGIPVADSVALADPHSPDGPDAEPGSGDPAKALASLGTPVVVKARRGGYDGRGNHVFDGDLDALRAALGGDWAGLYAEAVVPFDAELAVVAARSAEGDVVTYPTVRTVQHQGICHTVVAPAGLGEALERTAHDIAVRTVGVLDGAGVFAVEMFVEGDRVLVNEVAPRVHNSGHLTIEANRTSQFEQHVRAVTGLPLGDTAARTPAAAMVNILGRRTGPVTGAGRDGALALDDVHLHLYGKESRPGRKVGHVTALGDDPGETLARALAAREAIAT